MIEKVEDIIAWQKAREFNRIVFDISKSKYFLEDDDLKDHLRRSSKSIMRNIAEGFGRQTSKEFSQYLYIANGSVEEVKTCLYTAYDEEIISDDEFKCLFNDIDEISMLILAFLKYLRGKKTKKKII